VLHQAPYSSFLFFISVKSIAFFALTCSCFIFNNNTIAQQNQTYIIKGIITDSVSKKPLANATIILYPNQTISYANEQGMFEIPNVLAGKYQLSIDYLVYHPALLTIKIPLNETLKIELPSEENHLHDVIIATDKNLSISDYSLQNHSVLDAKKLDILRVQTMGDMLKNMAGVTLLNSGPSISKPVIRGLHSNRVTLLNNGIKQEGQNWGADHGPEIDPFAINKLEIIKGASSLQYGPEAIGGVIKVSAKDFKQQNGISGTYSLSGFSNNWQVANSLFLEGNHLKKQNLSWRFQASYRKAGDSKTPEYVLSNTAFAEFDLGTAVQYKFKNSSIEYSFSYFQSSLGILRAAHVHNVSDLQNTIANGKPSIINDFTYDIGRPKQEVTHLINAVKYLYLFKNSSKISIDLSQQINNRKEFDVLSFLSMNSDLKDKPAYDLTLTTNQISAKYEHKKFAGFKGIIGVSLSNQGNYATGKQFFIPNFISNNYGVYIIEKWNKKHWQAEGGIRYDWIYFTRYINLNNEVLSNDLNYQNASGSFGVSYLVNTYLKITGNISTAWRAPSVNELYALGLHAAVANYEQGNSNLIAEQSYNSELNIKYNKNKFEWDASIYHHVIDNFIYRLPSNTYNTSFRGVFPVFNYTQTNAILQGFETNLSYQLQKNISINSSYTFLHATDLSRNIPLIFMPANRIQSGINWQIAKNKKLKNAFIQINHQYVFEQTRIPAGIDFTNAPDAYQLVDFSFGANDFTKAKINWSIGMQNALNTSYRDYLSRYRYYALDAGRNVFIKLSIPF
jgi:iron complex outermembrane receptor protein